METGTQILVERMKTHPEEFIEGRITKWAEVMHLANDCLPDEDKLALKEAYTQAKVDRFNEQVLKTLAGENNPVEDTIRYKASERYGIGVTDPRGLFGQAQVKAEGQRVYDHNTDAFKYANAAQGLTTTIGSNGTSAVSLMPSAFGAVPRSTHD
jgi:hypothetical protein